MTLDSIADEAGQQGHKKQVQFVAQIFRGWIGRDRVPKVTFTTYAGNQSVGTGNTSSYNHKLRYKLITSTCYDFPIKVKWTLSDRGPVKGVITDTRYRSTATTTVLVSTLQRVLCGEGGRAGVALWWHKPMAQSVTPRRFIEHRIPRLLPRLLLGQTIDHQILKCRLFH